MRFLYVKLVGYIGLYSGLGLKEIELDFTKAVNKICVISGPNGVGKSTIINALNLMPDDNNCFVPSMEAYKIIKLTDGVNLYDITIYHGLNNHNERQTTKVSIIKNGIEMNPNGNVRSYKDIIQDEFELDSNYSVLSKIGGNDRGIADKTPAERKKIVSSIISSLEVYNNIYKVLNKKANTLKSLINNLGYKIQNIGSEESLNTSIVGMENRYNRLIEERDKAKESITKSKTIVAMSDPDGSMQSKLETYKNKSDKLKIEIMKLQVDIERAEANGVESKSEIEESIKSAELSKAQLLSNISSTSEKITSTKNEIEQIELKINKANGEIDPNLVTQLNITKGQIDRLKAIFNDIDIESISKDEVDFVIKFCSNLINQIDSIKEDSELDNLVHACNYLIGAVDIEQEYRDAIATIEDYKSNITITENIIEDLKRGYEVIKNLEIRPSKCKIDTCPFIAEALQIAKEQAIPIGEYTSRIGTATKQLNVLYEKVDKATTMLENFEKVRNISTRLRTLTDSIQLNLEILKKFPVSKRLVEINLFLNDLRNQSIFSELRNMNLYIDMSNSIVEYKSLLKVLLNLEAEYKIQQNTEKMINQYKTERDNKSKSLENLYSIFKNQISDRDFTNRLIEGLNIKLELSSKLESNKKLLEEKIIDKEEVDMDIKTINNKLQKSINEINNINIMSDKLKQIEAELMPITEAKKKAESQMEMLKSFKTEYATYKDQYNLLDILRKYSSPTAGSIQSLFMSIYMDKTLDMVNKLLGMIFNGQYQIARYVINENEFRIPFINANGMMVDDISGGSTSQVCIMGMIINLVLFTTGSTKYNIVSLDEIDGGLDHENRYLFVNILQQVCNMLNIDQLFIISHSVESALQAVDVVLLSDQEYYLNQFGAANVIYQYGR